MVAQFVRHHRFDLVAGKFGQQAYRPRMIRRVLPSPVRAALAALVRRLISNW